MGNEILAMIEKDSLHMRCLHLCGEIYGTVAASCVGGAVERCLPLGRFVHCRLLDAPDRIMHQIAYFCTAVAGDARMSGWPTVVKISTARPASIIAIVLCPNLP